MKKIIMTIGALALVVTSSVMAQGDYNRNQYPNQGGNQYPNQRNYNQYPNQNGNNQYPNQGGYNQYPNQGGYAQANPHFDDAQDWYRIERLDEIVNLNHRQKREIKRIEDRYDQLGLTQNGRLYPQDAQRLRWQKQQDIMSVLNPIQRDRLYAFQQGRRSGQGGPYGRRG